MEDLREGIAKSGGPPALFQQLLCGDKELQEKNPFFLFSNACVIVRGGGGLIPGWVGVGGVGLCVYGNLYFRDNRSLKC